MTTAFSPVEEQGSAWPGVIERYREHLPVSENTPVITLLEGNTPLIRAQNFVEAIGGQFELYLKYEAMNPTCSFKDRGMTMAISKAKERGAEVVICASTGNTSASAAALGLVLGGIGVGIAHALLLRPANLPAFRLAG